MYRRSILAPALGVCLATACSGAVTPEGSPPDDGRPGATPDEGRPPKTAPGTGGGPGNPPVTGDGARAHAPARVRRLTATELSHTFADVFLGGAPLALEFPKEAQPHGFENRFDGLGVSLPVAEALQTAAEAVAAKAAAGQATLFPCEAGKAERACAEHFVTAVGRRAFRRPLATAEVGRYLALYDATRKGADHAAGIGALVEAMAQSPHMLFRTELGDPKQAPGKAVPLTPFELASALSYFMWSSAPDDALLDAAAAGKLGTPAAIEAEARRMLADPRAKRGLGAFFLQWIDVTNPDGLAKNPTAFSAWTAKVSQAAVAESGRFFESVLWGETPTLATLLTAPRGFANVDLAKLYGVMGPKGAALEPIALDPKRRAGFLSQPAFLAAHTPPAEFSPIKLGKFVRNKLFCQTLPAPPNDIPPAPEPGPNVSTRQRFAEHQASPSCAGCHRLIDPVGFGFELLDPVGRTRDMESGKFPLTGEGQLTDTDVDGPFRGPVELAAKLVASPTVAACFSAHALEFALGRETAFPDRRLGVDAAALEQMTKALAARKGDLKEIFVAAATSDALRFRDTTGLDAAPAAGGKK